MRQQQTFRGFIFILLMLILIATAVRLPYARQADKVTNQDFVRILDDGQAAEVAIHQNPQTPTGEVVITLTDGQVKRLYVTDVKDTQKLLDDHQMEYVVMDVPQENYLVTIILPFMLSIVVVVIIIMVMNRSAGGGGANARMMNFGKSRARMSRDSKVNFSNVAGLVEEKEELEEVVDFLKNPQKYTSVGARIPKGLLLVGPPGTGKTSIARSLARALKKPYVRISLGGVRDEAEIRGHRKTYVGAMPGRIANGLRQAEVKNPLLLLDEIDKVSNDYKGDTFSALLEVLDSEQNRKFRDHYLEVPVDLSEVLFVTTANTLQPIPRPLLDRMEVIEVSSYTENEKMHIAMEHLIPKQLEKHGLKEDQLTISKKALWKMARNYTKEAGVRQLERKIGDICRKSAREILETKRKTIHVTERNLHIYLGKELYTYQMANEADEVGIVRGLAWTSVGGDTLQIEVNVMPGEGEILLTGQMGDVMKESARTGISYIRSVSGQHKIDEQFFKEHDVHIHIPEGAVPKDGPSAGITMATAMMSAVTGRKARADLAMTGEITLRGRVLPIGGLKEKLLAAKNAGIKTVLIPKENESDTAELSGEITKGLKIIPVSHMDEVLKIALTGKAVKQKNKRTD